MTTMWGGGHALSSFKVRRDIQAYTLTFWWYKPISMLIYFPPPALLSHIAMYISSTEEHITYVRICYLRSMYIHTYVICYKTSYKRNYPKPPHNPTPLSSDITWCRHASPSFHFRRRAQIPSMLQGTKEKYMYVIKKEEGDKFIHTYIHTYIHTHTNSGTPGPTNLRRAFLYIRICKTCNYYSVKCK